MNNYEKLYKEIEKLKKVCDKVMIYGFGTYGRNLYKILMRRGIEVDGYVVTHKSDNMDREGGGNMYLYSQRAFQYEHRLYIGIK